MKNKYIKITVIAILALAVWSFVPVVIMYLKPAMMPTTNAEAIEKLKNNGGENFKFIVFGDNHAGLIFNDSAALKSIWNINREGRFKKIPVDFVAVTGDVTFRGSGWDYRTYNKIRSSIKWPVISTMGNHDTDQNGMPRFAKYIGNKDFAFTDRNSCFIFIDNSDGEITSEQFNWLTLELEKSLSHNHRFLIMHKAPLSPYQQSWYRPGLSPWAYRFMKLCEKYKVDIVFSGHEHMFKESVYGGVKYITTGGGGQLTHFPDADGGFLHYLVVRVYGDYTDYEVRKVFPPFWEFLTYYIWKDLFYLLKDILF